MTVAVLPSADARRPAARTRKKPPEPELQPFTVPHFRAWSARAELDDGTMFVLDDFQASFLEDVFAGTPECWLIVPEGNGKTTFVALLALYHAEFRPYALVPIAASSREQAEIMYRQAEGFVLRSSHLHQLLHSAIQEAKGKLKLDVPRFTCLEGYRRINHHAGSRIQVMAAEDRTGDGVIPTMAIVDELHRHKDLSLYRTWAGKLDKRGGQLITISTAGEPGSDFELTRERIRQTATTVERRDCHTIARGPGVVLHEWAVPEKGDVTDMALVKRANPSPRITVESLTAKFAKSTMTLAHWRRLTCNLATRGSNAAITEAEWAKAATDEPIPEGVPVSVGLDVAWKWDTTAAVPLWDRDPEHRQFGPAEVLVPPRDGSSIDSALIEAALIRINDRNPIHTIVMDTSRAEQLGQWAEHEFGCTVIDWSQSIPVQVEEYDRFMDALRGGRLWHAGDAALTSHALNAIARVLPQGDAMFDRPSQTRQSSEQDRRVIDALKAAAMVHSFVTIPAPVAEEAYARWA